MTEGAFDAEWLALREAADHRARSVALVRKVAEESRRTGWSRAVDLGAGTGSNVRYLRRHLAKPWTWTLVDHDPGLLEHAKGSLHDPDDAHTVRAVVGDLAQEGLDVVETADLVTASALLDLVSESWLTSLVERCAHANAAVLFALSYDGSIAWSESDPLDEVVREALNEHQRGHKGLGPALGPEATTVAVRLLEDAGYRVWSEPTPWVLEARQDTDLMEALIEGWIAAGAEVRPRIEGELRSWADRRIRATREGRVSLRVGHRDLLAIPTR